MSRSETIGLVSHPPCAYRTRSRRLSLRALAVLLFWAPAVCLLSSQSAVADLSDAVAVGDRWKNLGNGALWDARTKQEWLQEDNGDEINWNSARSFCEERHRGWRMPSLPELKSIYDEHEPGVRCAQAICKVSSQFHLTGTWFWSATQVGKDSTDGIELAWGVLMTNGAQTQAVRDASWGSRVLCVRNP
jgi:hypothetical protein